MTRVFSPPQANISNVYGFMAKSLKQGLGRTREVGVDQKAHERSQPMGSGWWVSCSTKFFGIVDGGLDVFNGHLVLLAYLVEGHLACQPAEDAGSPAHVCRESLVLPCWISGSMMIRSCMIGLVVLGKSYNFFTGWSISVLPFSVLYPNPRRMR